MLLFMMVSIVSLSGAHTSMSKEQSVTFIIIHNLICVSGITKAFREGF